jgi:hypothetical protein
MHYFPNLNLATQAMLLIGFILSAGLVFTRVSLFLTRRSARIDYPTTWTGTDTKLFEKVRLSIGVMLGITWVTFFCAEPRMPQSWPFGFAQMSLAIGLLLLTNGWLLLLSPSNWENSIIGRIGFRATMRVLVWWWVILVGALLLAITFAVRPGELLMPIGRYAHSSNPSSISASLISGQGFEVKLDFDNRGGFASSTS